MVIGYSSGDGRRLLNLVEIVFQTAEAGKPVDEAAILDVIQNKVAGYDRTGDDRYQYISALHKSVRNSDVDAALFWLYRMLQGGEDPLYILRRLVRMAVEDIGLADPDALRVCLDAKEAYEFLGSPEGDLFLGEAAVYLALAPKSNALYVADGKLKKIAEKYKMLPVPLQIVNPDNFIAAGKGAGEGLHLCPRPARKDLAAPDPARRGPGEGLLRAGLHGLREAHPRAHGLLEENKRSNGEEDLNSRSTVDGRRFRVRKRKLPGGCRTE